METSIQLEEKLLGQALEYARQAKSSLSQVVSEALREKLGYQEFHPTNTGGSTSPVSSTGISFNSNDSSSLKLNPDIHPDIYTLTGLAPSDLSEKVVYLEHRLNPGRLAGRPPKGQPS